MALAFFEHCAEGRLEQVQRLLQEKAGAGAGDARRRLLSHEELLTGGVRGTPLHAAAAAGHSLVVRALVGAGADHSKTDSGGLPPLSRAAQHNKEDCVRELLKADASHRKDADGWTPIHYAAGHGGEESMLVLLLEDEGKAHLHRMWIKDNDGKSPFVLAFKRGIMSSFFKKLIEHDMGIRAETPNRQLETLVCDLLDIALTDDEAFSQFRDFLFDDRANTDSSILQILRLLAVLVDSKRMASFKFSDAEFSNLGKLVDDSLKDVLQSDFFQRPLATLALLAGALGNRARRRRHVKDDLLALRSKVVQLAVAVLDMPEMDGMDVALEALGYSCEDIDTGAFLTMDKFEKKGLVKEDAPLAFLIANKVNELIAVPQLQSSIDAVFYKARTTDVPPSDTFELSVWEEWSDPTKWKEKQEAAYPDKKIQVHEFYSLIKQNYFGSDELTGLKEELEATGIDCTNRPWKFMLNKGPFINDWKAQDWRMLPKLYWLSQFLLHGFYLVLTVLVFWHSEETSWYNGALLMMSVGYAAEELSQMLSKTGISHYVDDAWNVLDAMFLSSFFVWYATGDKVWLALNLFIVPFRMMHYLTIFKTSGILVAVLFRMIAATCRFLIFFTVILFGFAAMMFAFYGNQEIDGFGSFPDSCLSLFDASLGNYEFSIFDDLDEPWAGVVLLIIFLLLSAVMLLNLLIAVLSQEYSELANRAYMEWCFMYAQVVQQNVIQDSKNFIPGSRLPLHNLQLPPPLSLISYVAKFIVWISGYLEKCATSDRSSLSNSNGHDASIEICGDYGYHSLGQSNPKHLHSVGGIVQDHEQEPQNQAAIGKPAAWLVQILRYIAIIMIAAVDVAVHIIVGLPWALIMLYVRTIKIILGQDDIPKYVIMLLSFDYSIKRYEVDQRYGHGFLKAESGTKVKMATGWFLWLIFGIPLLSILAFIWWIPYASLKERVKQEGGLVIMPGSKAAEPSTEGLDEKIREAICKCAVTDDGSEFAQVLGEVAIVKSELADLKTEIAKLNQLLGARDG